MASPTESNPLVDSSPQANPLVVSNPAAGPVPATGHDPTTGPDQMSRPGPADDHDQVTKPEPGPGFDHLLELFHEVIDARAALTVARRAPLGRSRLVDAPRARLLLALEAYTAELSSRNLPVPYSIRDDLRIQRRILGKVAGASG
jgi:hypothetical protein